MYAVIMTGGKQYRVKEGDVLAIEKLQGEPGQQVDFDQVLLIEDDKTILVGTPILAGAVVRAEILETYKDEKVIVFKKKRRKQYKRKRGHRQILTKVRIDGIAAEGKSLPAFKAKAKKPEPVAAKAPPAKTEQAPKPQPEKKAKAVKKTKMAEKAAKASPQKAGAEKKAPPKAGAKPRKASKE
jgi:large subunit ribosomal protein L21